MRRKKKLTDIDNDCLAPKRAINAGDLSNVLRKTRPTMSADKYEKYLQLAKFDDLELNEEGRKTTMDHELEYVFNAVNEEEIKMGEYLSTFRQFQRYFNLANDKNKRIGISLKTFTMAALVLICLTCLIHPIIIWFIIGILAFLILSNSVLLPLSVVVYQTVITNTDTQDMIKDIATSEICGLSLLIFLLANGPVLTNVYHIYVINVLIEWFLFNTAISYIAIVVNFSTLKYKMYKKINIAVQAQSINSINH